MTLNFKERSIYTFALVMRRFVTSILMIAYMAAAIGFSFSFHYCGGEYHGICFTSDTEKDCCGEMEEGNDGCCEDKVISAKHNSDHAPSLSNVLVNTLAPVFILPARYHHHFYSASYNSLRAIRYGRKGPAPPLISGIPLYLFIRLLRI